MLTKNTLLSKRFTWLVTCVLFLLAASLWPRSVAASVNATATKDCTITPCTVDDTNARFELKFDQTVDFQATYFGTPNRFWVGKGGSNMADIQLTTSAGQLGGSKFLLKGIYFISVKTALMGPGNYTVTYNPSSTGEPHVTTTNGIHYDFQSAGEFVLLRHRGMEIQTRQAPVATSFNPGADPHDGLASCVSINAAVAARVGKHRVTYEPNLSGVPDPSGLQLRVDGVLTTLPATGLDLGSGGRITKTAAPGGLRIDFPDRSVLFVTPSFWDVISLWYLNLDMAPSRAAVGIAGAIPPRSWLPALPDGTSMGPMPTALHDRFVDLNQRFANAWRVTDSTSLFDYAPGTSTATFTNTNWPPENPPCSLPATTPVAPATLLVAQTACRLVTGEHQHDNCVFDVMVTGNIGFATTYLLSQGLQPDQSMTTSPSKVAVFFDLGGGFPHGRFANFFKTGVSFNAGLEYMFTPHVSAEGVFGYHRFPGKIANHVNLYQSSANAKVYLTAPPNKFRPFVNGGIGAYKFSPGSTKFGANVGVGVLYEVTPRFGLQGSYNFHNVNTPGSATRFSTLQGGVRFVF